jgi:hypothetical protein
VYIGNSVIIICSYDWWRSNKSIHPIQNPLIIGHVTDIRDSILVYNQFDFSVLSSICEARRTFCMVMSASHSHHNNVRTKWRILMKLDTNIMLLETTLYTSIFTFFTSVVSHSEYTLHAYHKRWSYPCNRPWRPIGLWVVEAPTFCLYSRLTDGCEVVSLTRRPPFTPQEDSWYSFLLEA